MSATTLEPGAFLSTHAYEQDIPPSIADGVAALLAQDRQIIVVTGKMDGRMSGFLADLSHGVSKRGTLLRIKAPLPPDEFFAALAAQLALPHAQGERVPVAARVGQRLSQAAPKGRFVLLCEGADRYEDATLEAVRQISNYPVSIVLAGRPALLRRLRRRRLAPLKSRVTHRLALNRHGLLANPFWLTVALLLAGGGALLHWLLTAQPPTEDVLPPRPISVAAPPPLPDRAPVAAPTPVAAPVAATQAGAGEAELNLVFEQDLARAPRQP